MQLEGKSHLFSEFVERIGICPGCIGQHGTNLQRTGQQYGGLEPDHLDILGLAHIGTGLEQDVVLLSFVYFKCRLGKGLHDRGQFVGCALLHHLKGHHQHGVAAEDGRIVVPYLVDAGLAPAHVGTVHHIVVEQCEVVIGFQPQRRL